MASEAQVHTACLAGYLEQLQGGTQLDSSGVFTLSGSKSKEKLRQFRLPDKRLYVLNAVAAVVALGAGSAEIYCDADDLILTASIDNLTKNALSDLMARILQDEANPGLRELGLAYLGPQARAPAYIRLETPYQRLEWPGDRLTAASGPNALRLHVHERVTARTARKFIARITGQTRLDSEEDALKRHCNLVPIPITLNGQPLARPIVVGQTDFSRLLLPPGLMARHPLASLKMTSSKGEWPALLARGGRLAPYLILVVNGVNFRLSTEALGSNDVRAIVYADHLRKDLSQASLVQNQNFQRVIQSLRHASSERGR